MAARRILEILTERLINLYEQVHLPDWPWFEKTLSYGNAKLPHALLAAGQVLGREEVINFALGSLDWLIKIQVSPQGYFVPIGTNGFYSYGSPRACFDQQPIETYTTLSACLEAYRFTGIKNGSWKLRGLLNGFSAKMIFMFLFMIPQPEAVAMDFILIGLTSTRELNPLWPFSSA